MPYHSWRSVKPHPGSASWPRFITGALLLKHLPPLKIYACFHCVITQFWPPTTDFSVIIATGDHFYQLGLPSASTCEPLEVTIRFPHPPHSALSVHSLRLRPPTSWLSDPTCRLLNGHPMNEPLTCSRGVAGVIYQGELTSLSPGRGPVNFPPSS